MYAQIPPRIHRTSGCHEHQQTSLNSASVFQRQKEISTRNDAPPSWLAQLGDLVRPADDPHHLTDGLGVDVPHLLVRVIVGDLEDAPHARQPLPLLSMNLVA